MSSRTKKVAASVLATFSFLAAPALHVPAHAQSPSEFLPTQSDAAPASAGPYTTVGRWLVDGQGKVVIQHGENIAQKRAPYTAESLGVRDEDAQFLADHGFNAVRLAIFWAGLEPQPGIYDERYIDSIKDTVAMFHRHGITTMIDLHQDAWSEKYGGDGAPDWAAIDDNFLNTHSGILGAGTNPANNQAIENFFANRPAPDGVGIRTHFISMWHHVAARLADAPGLSGYDLFNEPHQGWAYALCQADVCPPYAQERLESLYRDTAVAIRRADSATPIVFSGYLTTIFGVPPHLGKPPVDNAMYNYNTYCLALDIEPNAPLPLCDPQIDATADRSREYAERHNIPRVVTEFGATKRVDVLQRQTDEARQQQVGWFHWAYMGIDPATAAANPEDQAIVKDPRLPLTGDASQSNIQWDSLHAIEEPYPQSIAGTPLNWSFDRAHQLFSARWTPHRVDGSGTFDATTASTIWIPEHTFPAGYAVTVQGGRVVSLPGSRKLLVVSDGSGNEIRVDVRPA